MKINKLLLTIGIALMFFGIWGGSALLHLFKGTDYEFAAFTTAALLGMAGIFLTVASLDL